MKPEKLSSKQIILAISSVQDIIKSFLVKGKEYEGMIKAILRYDYYSEEQQEFPSMKGLQKELSLTSHQCRMQLERLYEDLFQALGDENTLFVYGDILCEFYVSGFGVFKTFFGKVSCPPRIGENIELPFLRPYFSLTHFYVEQITHNFFNGRQILTVFVRPGTYNLFEHLEIDRAKHENRYDHNTGRIIG